MARQLKLMESFGNRLTAASHRPSLAWQICSNIVDLVVKEIGEPKGRHYRPEWEMEFPWLETESGRMFCKLCRKWKSGTVFGTSGAGNFQHSTLARHNASGEHHKSVKSEKANSQTQPTEVPETDIQVSVSEQNVFRTVLYCGLKEKANSDVNDLLDLIRETGSTCHFRDLSDQSVKEIQQSLVAVLDKDLQASLTDSVFFGTMCDESTDIAVHKKLVLYFRYVESGKMQTRFTSNTRIADGKADTIVNVMKAKIQEAGLDMGNMVGLGSDGASVMTGRINGVGAQLKQCSPALVQVHCLAHRLALAASDSAKSCPYLKTFESKINSLYYHFAASGVRQSSLEAIQTIMEEKKLKLKQPTQVRWLSIGSAVSAIHTCYESILSALENDSVTNNNTTAKGLFQFMNTYKFRATLSLLCDVLCEVGHLSKFMQNRDLLYADLRPQLEASLATLDNFVETPGPTLRSFLEEYPIDEGLDNSDSEFEDDFDDEIQTETTNRSEYRLDTKFIINAQQGKQFQSIKRKYLTKLIQCINQRVYPTTESQETLESVTALTDPLTCRISTPETLKQSLEVVCNRFNTLLDLDKVKTEFIRAKAMMKGVYQGMKSCEYITQMLTCHKDLVEYCKLLKIVLCIPLTSVECERGFSCQNRIKDKFRSSLETERLELLMKLSCSSPGLSSFPYVRSISHWRQVKNRRLKRLFSPTSSGTTCTNAKKSRSLCDSPQPASDMSDEE